MIQLHLLSLSLSLSMLSCSTMFQLPVVFFTLLSLVPIFILIKTRRNLHKRLPPGSLGIPFIGESLSLLRAMRTNTDEEWFEKRLDKYGPVSKLMLFGSPTILVHGKDANKFVFTCSDGNTLNNQPPQSFRRVLGKWNLFELSGEDHKRVKAALMAFLKPDALKLCIGKMETEVRNHLTMHWDGKEKVTVLPLMKTLAFNIMCSVLFGLEAGERREYLISLFTDIVAGLLAVPINLPFTQFSRSIKASTIIHSIVMDIIHERRLALETQQASPNQDLITSLLSMHGEDNAQLLSDEEIVGNIMFLMVAGHESSATLVTFLLRQLAGDPVVYETILKEQEEIAKNKALGELLTWEDLTKMNYTWRSSLEMLRIVPTAFGGFRKAVRDVEFGGYILPKGWQVLWVSSSTHMNKSIFPEPSKFDPERFNNQASIPPYCFVGFGGGTRLCPGYEFARIETSIIMHYLVTRFTWKLCGKDNKFSRELISPTPTQGLPIQIETRKLSA